VSPYFVTEGGLIGRYVALRLRVCPIVENVDD
jgi:hypothetical protein